MCGIIGLFEQSGCRIDPMLIKRCNTIMRHRGPDDEGYLLGDSRSGRFFLARGDDTDPQLQLPLVESFTGSYDLALAHRRLAILDLSTAGHQPMVDASGKVIIVYNGEIFNYVELKAELRALGYCFHSESDTEVLLAAYSEWGMDSFNHFIGMWALTLWDTEKRQLICSRDPFGIKPFYYTVSENRFAFASEIKALLEISGVRRTINPQRTFLYLRWGETDFGDETMFSEISQLQPGCHMVVSLDQNIKYKTIRYWQPNKEVDRSIRFNDAVARTRELFLENTALHMRTDVPLGSALSGGIDSSALVCGMRSIGGPSIDLHTFSYVAGDPRISEKKWIDMINVRTAAISHPVFIEPDEIRNDLDRMIYMQDEPFGSTRIYAQYRIYRKAKESGITVLLNGQGADEVLAGYYYFLGSRWASMMKQMQWARAIGFAKKSGKRNGWNSYSTIAFGSRKILPMWMQPFFRLLVKRELAPAWINKDWFTRREVDFKYPESDAGSDCLKDELRHSLSYTSLPHLLRYEDRNSMSWSIENRVPFLTTKFSDFLFSLPEEFLISDTGRTKNVFSKAIRGLVPDAIIDRTDKIGFETPERQWMGWLREWGSDVLSLDHLKDIPVFNAKLLLNSIDGSRLTGHSEWRCLCFLKWCDKYGIVFD